MDFFLGVLAVLFWCFVGNLVWVGAMAFFDKYEIKKKD